MLNLSKWLKCCMCTQYTCQFNLWSVEGAISTFCLLYIESFFFLFFIKTFLVILDSHNLSWTSSWMGFIRTFKLRPVTRNPGSNELNYTLSVCLSLFVCLSLCVCVVQVFSQLRGALGGAAVSVHLVEVSPKLSQVQAQCLTGDQSQVSASEDEPVYRQGTSTTGLPISWYRNLDDVPRGSNL